VTSAVQVRYLMAVMIAPKQVNRVWGAHELGDVQTIVIVWTSGKRS